MNWKGYKRMKTGLIPLKIVVRFSYTFIEDSIVKMTFSPLTIIVAGPQKSAKTSYHLVSFLLF